MSKKNKKYFGTDGIRGRVGHKMITADCFLKLGWAIGKVLSSADESNRFLIGKDTRISGYMLESALQAGFIAAGASPGLLGPMPTPAISYLTRTLNATAGIVISASHNSHHDNGIKLFNHDGYKLDDEVEFAIEAQFEKDFDTVDSEQLGKAFRVSDAVGRYAEFCKASALGLSLRGKTIILDCAQGATYQVAPKVFSELGAQVITMACEPDGLNINLDCGSTKPSLLQSRVLAEQADLGIAFDGDGDRLIMVDHEGELLDGDDILFILADHMASKGILTGVAGTLMTNLNLEQAFLKREIPFARTAVGDRYVIEKMRDNNWNLGGESSGHIICGDSRTGDGIITALRVLLALQDMDITLTEAKSGLQKTPQKMINISCQKISKLASNKAIWKQVETIETEMGTAGRVLLRPSGTEPVVRVMIECDDLKRANRYCKELADLVESELN